MMRKYHVRFGGGPGEKAETSDLACGLPYLLRRSGHWARLTASVRWPARRVVGEARYPSARGCAGGSIGTETVPAVGGLRDSAGAPWERGDVAGTSALPPPNNALERTGHSGHPWPAWGCTCGPPLTASVRCPVRRDFWEEGKLISCMNQQRHHFLSMEGIMDDTGAKIM